MDRSHAPDALRRPDARELLRRVRRIELATRRAVEDRLAGQYHSVFKGRGMAFSDVRAYAPGDEVRAIDWNVTARTGQLHVKRFVEERELTVVLLVDASASADFGSRERTKAEVTAEIAALVAFSAVSNGDRVGLVLFTDRVERFVPPRKGRRHALRLVSEVLRFRPEGRRTSVGAALEFLRRALPIGSRRSSRTQGSRCWRIPRPAGRCASTSRTGGCAPGSRPRRRRRTSGSGAPSPGSSSTR